MTGSGEEENVAEEKEEEEEEEKDEKNEEKEEKELSILVLVLLSRELQGEPVFVCVVVACIMIDVAGVGTVLCGIPMVYRYGGLVCTIL